MIPFYDKAVFDLPNGPKNLAALFPAIDWSRVVEYEVRLKDADNNILVNTPMNVLRCAGDSSIKVHFQNNLGRFDMVPFARYRIQHDNSSSEYKTGSETERFNIRSNETYEAVTTCYNEEDQKWLSELADTAKAFLQLDGFEGRADTFVSIKILDGKFEWKKIDDDFQYVFSIQFKMAVENNLIQN